jgi:hypothetical protein
VLLVPRDAVIGALMSELLRFAGYRPVLLGVDESPAQGVARVAMAIAFVDAEHPAALSPELELSAAESGTRIVLYSGARTQRDLEQTARRHGASAFALPNGPRALQRTIAELLEAQGAAADGTDPAEGAPRPPTADGPPPQTRTH